MKQWMKRILPAALGLSLLFSTAMAKEVDLTGRPIANGVVSAVEYADVTAPFSGTLSPFDLSAGDRVEAAQPLLSYVTTDLYASEGGTLAAVFANAGDDAAAVCGRYGGVLGIEPTHALLLNASTSGASSDAEYKLIHLGETLYFQSSKSDKEEGTGRVIAVNGSAYQVEILTGSFDLDDSMSLYRTDKYDTKKCVGKGVVTRRADALMQAQGRVMAVLAAPGDAVSAGQKLMTLLSADAPSDVTTPDIASPVSGVVSAVAVNPGQQVWKGQLLCRIDRTDALEVVADVDEMDLGSLAVGDSLPVTLDVNKDNILTGTVSEISALGVQKLNAAYYTVHVTIPAGSAALGASASVYLPEKD